LNIEAEVEFYKGRSNRLLNDNRRHLISLYGQDGYELIKNLSKSKPVKPFAVYKRSVWEITEQQPLHLLENCERRGFKDYHVDHIVSIFKAYKLGWTVKQCADISNLQMLPFKENLKKGIK